MKNMFTLKRLLLSCYTLVAFLGVQQQAVAQLPINWAIGPLPPPMGTPVATFVNPNPIANFGPELYNDNIIPSYPATGLNEYTYVNTGETIKAFWSPPPNGQGTPTPVDTIDKIVFYKNTRPMSSCWIVHFNSATLTYDTIMYYNNQTNLVADSVFVHIPINDFVAVGLPVDTILFQDVQAPKGLGNPDFREIQLWRLGGCTGTPAVEIYAGIELGPQIAGPLPAFPTSIINLCPGYSVHIGANTGSEKWHAYQWQINTGTGWTNIPGATGPGYVYNGIINADFRVADTCINSGLWSYSNVITVQINTINYQPVGLAGYYMGFDNPWATSPCMPAPYANDLPSDPNITPSNWSNDPPFGATSWRLDSTSNLTTPTSATTPTNSGWQSVNAGAYSATANRYPYLTPAPAATRKSARLHTSNTSFIPGQSGKLDMYLNLSAVTGDKALYFYYINQGATNWDTLKVQMSTNGGQTWSLLGVFDSAGMFKKKWLPLASNASQAIIRFEGYKSDVGESTDMGIDSIFVAAPCTGTPVAGRIKPSVTFTSPTLKTVTVCPGTSLELYTLGTTMNGGLVYEWQHDPNGLGFVPINGGQGSNGLIFTTPPNYDTVKYRLALKCGPTGITVYSDTLTVYMSTPAPTYASLPYRQNFESWGNGCSTGDIVLGPNNVRNWANTSFPTNPQNASWRRNDFSNATIWTSPGLGMWWPGNPNPNAQATPPGGGNYSARFHSNNAFTNQKGSLDLLFNGSSSSGNKELRFFYINTGGNDSLQVYYSADAGANFTKLATYKNATDWTQNTVQIPCVTQNCIVRFEGSAHISNQSDIGIDSVTVYPACSGLPNVGTLSYHNPCAGANFTITLQGNTPTGNISYVWEKSTDSVFWTSAQPDTTRTYLTTNIPVHTWYRVIATCLNSGLKDTTIRKINVAEFYYCYCTASATNPAGPDVGNVNIKRLPAGTNILNNGNPLPQNNNNLANRVYTDFRIGNPAGGVSPIVPPPGGIPPSTYPTPIYHDTSYQLLISQINSANFTPSTVTVWIDTDRNGFFDMDEVYLSAVTSTTTTPPQRVDVTFSLPASTPVGVTGMRVMLEPGTSPPVPCGTIGSGEVEDYLIEIRNHPCTGPASAGIVEQSDTAVCAGYAVTFVDTTHATKQYGLRWVWQYSPDSNSWADLPNSTLRDTVQHIVTAQTWYRVRMVCLMTFDTTYSNVVKVKINPPYACYCFSLADGGGNPNRDTSDIGGMSVTGSSGKGITIPSVGPHLLNQWAVNSRTDWTKTDTLHLWLDSTYQILVYHTIRPAHHGDAKVTLFMDLNSDGMYNVTDNPFTNELLWTGYTTSTYFTIVDSITIPTYAIPGVLTGMRLILNNDTGPNPQSDSACGAYVSGETEDFVVMFHNNTNPWWPASVNNLDNISNFQVYPNPTTGKFWITFDAVKPVKEATIIVTNVTGQQVVGKQVINPGKKLMEEIDISTLARGVYMVELKADDEKLVRKLIVK